MDVAEAITRPEAAFAGVLLCVVASDGSVAESESQALYVTLRRLRMFRGWTENEFEEMLRALLSEVQRHGLWPAMSTWGKQTPVELRPTLFAAACDLALADANAAARERRVLDHLQNILMIEPALAAQLTEAMMIKNRG